MELEAFYNEYVDKVYKFFYIKCLDKHTAEDLTSDTFMRFLKQSHERNVQDNKKYLYGIMRIVWVEFLKEKYAAKVAAYEEIEDFADYAEEEVESFEEKPTHIERLAPYVARLPKKQQAVLRMRIYEDMSVRQTAEAVGKDSNYVKTTYKRAVHSLRKMLTAPYEEEEAIV